MDIYKFNSLPSNGRFSIRLLEFTADDAEPCPSKNDIGSISFPIRQSLRVHDLESAPEYEALSYAWGMSSQMTDITINHQQMPIKRDLHEVFGHLTKGIRDGQRFHRRLWVDGICINQKNAGEKSDQVAQMKDIYQQAQCVIVWLGPEDEETFLAFDTLAHFAEDDGTTDASKSAKLYEKNRVRERRIALDSMIQKPWFSRIWVIQEVVVARKVIVHWGYRTIDWKALHLGLQRATGSGFFTFSNQVAKAISIGQWRKMFHDQSSPDRDEAIDTRILIKDGSDKEASNLRDKVYALRGIASDAYAKGIIVNYQDTVEKVYIDCAKHILQSRRDLRLLSIVRQHARGLRVTGLPSWVPDWSQAMDRSGVINRYYRFKPNLWFRANGANLSDVVISGQSDIISLSGNKMGQIDRVLKIRDLLTDGKSDDTSLSPSSLLRYSLICSFTSRSKI